MCRYCNRVSLAADERSLNVLIKQTERTLVAGHNSSVCAIARVIKCTMMPALHIRGAKLGSSRPVYCDVTQCGHVKEVQEI
jgi:hypothetical protein